MLIKLGAVAIIPIGIILIWVSLFIKTHGAGRLIVRFATGMHLDGQHRTNAGFLTPGNKIRHHSGRASRWAHMRHAYKAIIRWLSVLILAAITFGLIKDMPVTLIGLEITGAGLILLSVYLGIRKARGRHHIKVMHTPLALTLAPVLQVTPVVVSESLTVRRDYAKARSGEHIGSLILPDTFSATPGEKEAVASLFDRRLGVETRPIWHTSRHPMSLDIVRAPIPPGLVPFAKMVPEMRKLQGDKILLGLAGDSTRYYWDMATEEPMMFTSATSRRGKTRLLLLMACQILNRGGSITVIDPKAIGVDEILAGHPNADVYANPADIPAIWNGIHKFRLMLDERIKASAIDRTKIHKRATLFVDEISVLNMISQNYWGSIKTNKDRSLAPMWDDLTVILFQGAQFNVNMCVFGQRVDFRTLGGLIDGFGTRMLAGHNKATYNRLIGIPPQPAPQKPRGRFLYYNMGDEYPVYVQTVLGSDTELRTFAFESVSGMPGVPVTADIPSPREAESPAPARKGES